MADIFLSHSTADDEVANLIKAWLERDRGSWSVFLEHDNHDGVLAGQCWQNRLRSELQSCRLVLAIITPNWIASRWCFTEAVIATFRGKDFVGILPNALPDSALDAAPPIVHARQRQLLDLVTGAGWQELLYALDRSGLDPSQWFAIPEGVGPYPGFVAYEERDAGVFFGRDQEITEYLNALNVLKAPDRAQALVISGGSGSGKSSLLKAGLIPRLRNQPDWLIIPPFDPSREPVHALFAALRTAAEAIGAEIDLSVTAPQTVEELAEQLNVNLRAIEEKANSWILLPLDQTEALLAGAQERQETEATRLLAAIGQLLAARSRKIVAALTIRTEFKPALERALPDAVSLDDRSLRAITVFSEIIERPAARFGIELEKGLTGRMVEDSRGAGALPLLAYTLRELHDKFGQDNHLTVAEYERLGGVEGAIETKLDQALSDPEPTKEELKAFRRLFVRQLVKVDENAVEGDRYLRTTVARDDLPDVTERIVNRLLDARLLISSEDGAIGIAHDRLIRNWRNVPLQTWLVKDRDDRKLIDNLKSFLDAYRKGGPLLSEKPLLDALDFLERDPALKQDEHELTQFIEGSVRSEESRLRRQKWQFRGAIAASLLFLAVAVGAVWFFLEAERQTEVALKRVIETYTERGILATEAEDAGLALLWFAEALRLVKDPTTERLLRKRYGTISRQIPKLRTVLRHDRIGSNLRQAFDGRTILVIDNDTVRLVRRGHDGDDRKIKARTGSIVDAALSPEGNYVALITEKYLEVWDRRSGNLVYAPQRLDEEDGGHAVAFNQDGSMIATVSEEERRRRYELHEDASDQLSIVEFWSTMPDRPKLGSFKPDLKPFRPFFSADGTVLRTSNWPKIWMWKVPSGEAAFAEPFNSRKLLETGRAKAGIASDDGSVAVTVRENGCAILHQLRGKKINPPKYYHDLCGKYGHALTTRGPVVHGTFSADGNRLVFLTENGRVQVLQTDPADFTNVITFVANRKSEVEHTDTVSTDHGGERLVTVRSNTNGPSEIRVWHLPSGLPLSPRLTRPVDPLRAEIAGNNSSLVELGGQILRQFDLPNARPDNAVALELPGDKFCREHYCPTRLWESTDFLTIRSRDRIFIARPKSKSVTSLDTPSGTRVSQMAVSADGTVAAALVWNNKNEKNQLVVWNLPDLRQRSGFELSDAMASVSAPFETVSLDRKGHRLLVSVGSQYRLFDVKTGRLLFEDDLKTKIYHSGLWGNEPHGFFDTSGGCRFINLSDGKDIRSDELRCGKRDTILGADERMLIRKSNNEASILLLDTLFQGMPFQLSRYSSLTLGPLSQKLFLQYSGNVEIRDVTGENKFVASMKGDTVAAISPDGKLVLTLDSRGEGRLWTTETGRLFARGIRQSEDIIGAQFSTDGDWLYTITNNGEFVRWDLRPDPSDVSQLVQRAQLMTQRRISEEGTIVNLGASELLQLWDNIGSRM